MSSNYHKCATQTPVSAIIVHPRIVQVCLKLQPNVHYPHSPGAGVNDRQPRKRTKLTISRKSIGSWVASRSAYRVLSLLALAVWAVLPSPHCHQRGAVAGYSQSGRPWSARGRDGRHWWIVSRSGTAIVGLMLGLGSLLLLLSPASIAASPLQQNVVGICDRTPEVRDWILEKVQETTPSATSQHNHLLLPARVSTAPPAAPRTPMPARWSRCERNRHRHQSGFARTDVRLQGRHLVGRVNDVDIELRLRNTLNGSYPITQDPDGRIK